MKEFGEIIKGVEYHHRPGSYGVVIKNGQCGVIRSTVFNKYFLPGGGIEKGETEIAALHREALEEIGFEIEIGEKIGVAAEYFFDEHDRKYFVKECHFYCFELKEKVGMRPENQLIWIGRNELEEMYHRSHQWIVETVLDRTDLRDSD